jgi:hypothetical protein
VGAAGGEVVVVVGQQQAGAGGGVVGVALDGDAQRGWWLRQVAASLAGLLELMDCS